MRTVILPSLNEHLLGDKVVLSAAVALFHAAGADLWGTEGSGSLSMASFASPPVRLFRGPSGLANAFGAAGAGAVLWLVSDHNSSLPWEIGQFRTVRRFDLWQAASIAARSGLYPRIQLQVEERQRGLRLLCRRENQRRRLLVAVHARNVARDATKNIDSSFISELCRGLAIAGIDVVLIGTTAGTACVDAPQAIGMVDATPSALDLAAVLSCCDMMVGGDSGPTHLAGAVGCPILCLGAVTRRFGPFVPPRLLVHQFGSTVAGFDPVPRPAELARLIAGRLSREGNCGSRERVRSMRRFHTEGKCINRFGQPSRPPALPFAAWP